jgi:hypothetical protein
VVAPGTGFIEYNIPLLLLQTVSCPLMLPGAGSDEGEVKFHPVLFDKSMLLAPA